MPQSLGGGRNDPGLDNVGEQQTGYFFFFRKLCRIPPVGDKICRIPLDLKFYAACPQFAHAVYAIYPHNNQHYAGYPHPDKQPPKHK
jgi:hypothetical protein